MDNRKSFDNVHPTDTVCLTPWIGFPQNWGLSVIDPTFTVRLDPRVETARTNSPNIASRQPSLDEMMEEFTDWNDDILRELAR